jgi:serine/threonine protein phosphatase 1
MRFALPFRRPSPTPRPPTAFAPVGRRIYAVGDIHGRADLLKALLAKIETDRAQGGYEGRAMLVFIGDYIDRGLQSRDVIDALIGIDRSVYEPIYLIGNHEAALLNFLERPSSGRFWLSIGGGETMFSYGALAPAADAGDAEFEVAAQALRDAMPASHHEFLDGLKLTARLGDYLFVHAGVRPGRALEDQDVRDLLQVRESFLKDRSHLGFKVVHGHTPETRVHNDERRIGLDTGAYATGRLSAVRLQDDGVQVIST